MAFAKTQQLSGDTRSYSIAPEIKRYSLLDLGFSETKNGNFIFKRAIDPDSPFEKASIKLKITVNADMTQFKMNVVDADELNSVSIFSGTKYQKEQTEFHYLMQQMVLKKVFQKS